MTKTKLSTFAETLIASEIVRLGAAIKELIKKGEKLYNYTIGDFDSSQFPIPEQMEKEIVASYHAGYTTYPAAEGELDLRSSISDFIYQYQGVRYSPQEVLVSCGGRPLIYALFKTIVDPGDKVIYPVPSWNNNHYTHFNHGEHVVIEAAAENNFMPTADQIRPHVKGASLIAVCSPLNPTGTTFKKADLEAICDLIIEENKSRKEGEKKLYLMFDQMYWMLTFGDIHHYSPVALRPEMKEYTIFIDGISKAFAATGVRVGWSLGPEEVMVKMRSLNSHVGSWAPMAEQKAVAKFLKQLPAVDTFLAGFKNEIDIRLVSIHNGIQALREKGYPVNSIAPQAAIYLTIQVNLTGRKTKDGREIKTQEDVTNYLLSDAHLALVPFVAFGANKNNNWYRLSVGCCKKEDIPDVLKKLEVALENIV